MDTFPFAYECARKQGSLDNMSLPELINCGKCAAEVINAKDKESNFDVSKSESCGVCFNKITTDKDEAPKAMTQFVGCCNENIKNHISKQSSKEEATPSRPRPQKPQKRREPPPSDDRDLTEPPLRAREDIYDQFEHEVLLPRYQ